MDKKQPNVNIKVGSNITLECIASGYPLPKISWKKFQSNFKGIIFTF